MNRIQNVKTTLILILIIFMTRGSVLLYSAGQKGSFGTQDLFSSAGVGARALGLGNAYVALPQDATAVYWNPAGMETIQRKTVTLFHTNLIVPGSYMQYVGYVHPTINIGTLGVAAIRLGVDDIKETDEFNYDHGTFSHTQGQFLISYGKQLPFHISGGLSLKFVQWEMNGYSDMGIGADLAFLYRPNYTNIFLRNISVGMNIQNILEPRLKPNVKEEYYPYNIKFGMAKPISMNEWGGQLTLFLDFEQGGGVTDMKYHTGTEYIFQNMFMLRFGLNNSSLSFGGGVNYNEMLQIDYSFGKMADHELDASHRFSISFHFGSSKDELIQIANKKKRDEIDNAIRQRIEWEKNERIAQALEAGKRHIEELDWARAVYEFNIVLQYEDEDPNRIEIQEAKKLLKYAQDEEDRMQKKEYEEISARNEKERDEHEKRIFINEHNKKALTHYEHEEYERAIIEWNRILERYPDNELAQEFIKKARIDFETKMYSLIRKADELGKRKKYLDAIDMLNRALRMNPDDKKIRDEITRKKVNYGNQLTFWGLYQQGREHEIQRRYNEAMEMYKRALDIDPKNNEVRDRYDYVRVRANAKREPIKPEIRQPYFRSVKLTKEGKYKEALQILEEIQKVQPFNKEILDAIDRLKIRISQQNRR